MGAVPAIISSISKNLTVLFMIKTVSLFYKNTIIFGKNTKIERAFGA
jgi:hypothetical protein